MLKLFRSVGVASAVFCAVGLSVSPATATTFDFTRDFLASIAPDSSSKTFVVDGIQLTVTAGTFPRNPNPSEIDFSTRLVDQDFFSGLGADSGLFEDDDIDGNGGNDVLVFSFSPGVVLESIDFGNVDGNDDFAFGAVDGTTFSRIVDFQDVENIVDSTEFPALGLVTASDFGIGAIGGQGREFQSRKDDFTIQRLTVSLFSPAPNPITVIPAPAALPLLASGLGVFGLVGWRRRKAAQTS